MKKKFIGQYRFCDLITMCGSLSAILGIILSLYNHFYLAILLMIICALCDCFDGYFSRKKENTVFQSTYGSELDSLSDIICFGIFPAIFVLKSNSLPIVKYIVPIYILCGLIRLTYFNTLNITKTNEKGYFKGVPITTSSFVLPFVYLTRFMNHNLYKYLSVSALIILGILFITNIKIKKPDINNIINYFKETHYNKLIRLIINFIIFPIFLIIISDMFFKTSVYVDTSLLDAFKSVYYFPLAFLFILCIFILVTLISTGIFKSTTNGKFALMILATIFLVINDVKYIIMNNPVMLSDVNYLNTSNVGTAGKYLNAVIGVWIIKVIIKATLMILMGILIKKSKLSEIKFNYKSRLAFIFIPFMFLYIIIGRSIRYSNFMIEKVYNYNYDTILYIDNFSYTYYEVGLYQGIMFNKYSSKVFKPKNYSKKEVKKILSKVTYETDNWKKPNIVIILSESFSDLSKLNEITFDKDLLSSIHYLETLDSTVVTDLYTSTYGGQSVVSEWEVETASSNQFFIPSYIAYNEYYHNKKNKNIDLSPHIIHSLTDYFTEYLTPWPGQSYNSKYTYEKLGIDKTKYNLKGDIKGTYLADYEITESILKELKKNPNQPKLLIYATGEGHMPCYKDKFDKYDIEVTNSTLNTEETDLLKCYAQGIYDADKELGILYNELQNIKEDTIVIFYGDHHPYITDKNGQNIYLNLPYFNTDDKNLNDLRQYTTKGVIFSNYINKMDKSIKYINLSYLGAYVYSHLDIKDKDYFNFVNNTRKIIPVFSRKYIYNPIENKFYDHNNVSKEEEKAFKNYQKVQYYEFFDKK